MNDNVSNDTNIMEENDMKVAFAALLFWGVFSFAKSFVGGIENTASSLEAHNSKVEAYYAQVKK